MSESRSTRSLQRDERTNDEVDDGTDTLLIFFAPSKWMERKPAALKLALCLEQQFAFRSATFVTRLEMQEILSRKF